MKAHQRTEYECQICRAMYPTEAQALECEARPVTEDRGVKIGDKVLITAGEGKGSQCLVTEVFVIKKDWGHYQWKRYWHTVAVVGDVVDSYGSRMLTFDSYALNGRAE